MKIKLLIDLPQRDLKAGDILETIKPEEVFPMGVTVLTKDGKEFNIHFRHFSLIEEDEEISAPPVGCLC